MYGNLPFYKIQEWPGMNPLEPRLSQNPTMDEGPGAILSFKTFLSFINKLLVTLFLGAPKSLQMVTAVMKLKDAYSLEGKL